MKLIQKKCPSCGAGLKFKSTDKEVLCDYCKQSFIIDNENILDVSQINENLEQFNEVLNKPINKTFVIFVFIISILMIGGVAFGITRIAKEVNRQLTVQENNKIDDTTNDIIDNQENKVNNSYVTELGQIDDEALEKMHNVSLEKLEFYLDYGIGNWEYVGIYFLNRTNDKEIYKNMIFDVYKLKYKSGYRYGLVRYTDFLISDGKVISDSFGFPIVPFSGDISEFEYGYSSLENLYNSEINTYKDSYNISCTDGLYIG